MDKKIQVLDVVVHNCSAKEAMIKMVDYIQQDTFHVVEAITMQSLVRLLEEEEHQYLNEYDFTFAGDKEVLEAGGVTEPECLREAEDMLFLKMFFRYLHKHHKRVFLLFDEEEILQKVTSFIREDYRDMKIVDCVVLDGQGSSEEMIVNQINGVETDCVMAFMSSPEQEAFLSRNRALINTKIWLGLGRDIYVRMKENTWFFRLKKFLTSHFLKRKIEKEQRKL